MVVLLIQNLAIYNNEHLPNTIKMAKVQSFAKYKRNAAKLAKDFKMLAKVAKFCQIWSRCSQSEF